VTLQNITGASAAGTYALTLLDGGALRGDITRPIAGTTGFSVALGSSSVSLGSAVGSQATYTVTVTVDGRPAPLGLAEAGPDVNGEPATEFLWWVVASGSNGVSLRMPFYYRASTGFRVFRQAPVQDPIQDDATPDQVNGVDQDGNYRLSWSFAAPPAEQPCAFRVDEASSFIPLFTDDGSDPLVAGGNSQWSGDPQWISSVHPDTMTPGYSLAYTDQLDVALTQSKAVAIPAGTKAQLSFDAFQDLEDGFDFGYVEVSADGGNFQKIAGYTGSFSGQRVLDLSGFAGRSIKVRFHVTSDLIVSTPLWLGWFLDNIRIETADWTTIGTVGSSTLNFDVTDRFSGTYYYRIAGKFGPVCNVSGPYSNIRPIAVEHEPPPPRLEPTASFTANPNPAQVGETVTFDASASHDNDSVGCDPNATTQHCITRYFWSFGDGATQTATGPTTSHAYASAGTYRVALTVTDDDDQTASAEAMEEVSQPARPKENKATGGGSIPIGGDRAHFGFNASRQGTAAPTGNLSYDDKGGHVKVLSESITSLTVTGNRATFSGACSVNKVSGFTFTVDVIDNGDPGSNDFFRIRLSTAYEKSGTLSSGNIQVHPAKDP